MRSLTVTKTYYVSDEEIDDIMITALEGGIRHWCDAVAITKRPEEPCERAFEVISRGGELKLFNDEDDETYILTLDKFLAGLQMFLCDTNEDVTYRNEIDPANIDAEMADCIVQFALFGKLVYS